MALEHNKQVAADARTLQEQINKALVIFEEEFGFTRNETEDDGKLTIHIDGID